MVLRVAFVFSLLFLFSCETKEPSVEDQLSKLAEAYRLQPTEERANSYFTLASTYIGDNKENFEVVRPILLKASEIGYQAKMFPKSASYLMPVLQQEGANETNSDLVIRLGDLLRGMRKTHAADIVYKSYLELNPNAADLDQVASKMTSELGSSKGYLKYLFDQVLVDPDEFGINRVNALKFVDGAEAFALINKNDEETPQYLYQAAEVARSLRTMPKAMSLYDWILDSYPDYPKSPTVLFIKGFILEQEFKQEDEARKAYQDFIERYPNHEMASSAQFLLDNMGKSDEEILESIEAQKSE